MSAALHIDGLAGRWGSFDLSPVRLEIPKGAYAVVLGPSGCGKTTLLELLCGLRVPAAGRIALGGRDITYADPADRRIGYVPQEYHLFSGRTTEWNLRFSARMRHKHGEEMDARFARVADMLHLAPFLNRSVDKLSGGERQRVALARALMTDPELLVLDEPVSALPESLRDPICRELKALQVRLGITTIHVCHNLDEALVLGDQVVVMDTGRIVQEGTPQTILDAPESRFVAEFTQCKNLWEATVASGTLCVAGKNIATIEKPDRDYLAVVRPEHIRLAETGMLPGQVLESRRTCHGIMTHLDLGDFTVWACDDRLRIAGETLSAHIPEDRVVLLPRKS